MTSVNCLILDDEPIARDIIKAHVSKVSGWQVVGSCQRATEAYEVLLNKEVDVIFLDIEMPGTTGIDFLKSLKKPPLVIFTTAYQQYAVDGFDLNIADYLLKPITIERFLQAVEKVKQLLTNTPEATEASHCFIKHEGKLVKIQFEDIAYIQAEKDFSSLYLSHEKLFVSMHLKMFEDLLPSHSFTRIHRSYIIPHGKVEAINGNTVQIKGTEIPIGSSYKEALFKALKIE
ncbi:MAG: response regulator transcription factor [Roseivirga sp.]|nr:response regulator transcription factor [Roseivirga sp.]